MSTDDQSLVRQSLSGDNAAFDELVKRYSPRVFHVAQRFFKDKYTVEDIAQEVFLKAYTSLHTFGQQKPFDHWLTAIAFNTCYRELGKQKNAHEHVVAEFNDTECHELSDFILNGSYAAHADPEKKALLRDLADKILVKLSPREKMILILMEVEGMTLEEVSKLWGISSLTLKVCAFRARRHARKILMAVLKKTAFNT